MSAAGGGPPDGSRTGGAPAELVRSLGALADSPGRAPGAAARALGLGELPTEAEYTDLFVLQLVPYASVYLGPEGMLGGEARDRIAGFWRALGHTPPAEPDHLTLLLGLYAELVECEAGGSDDAARARYRLARAALFWEHLASWLPVYLARVSELGGDFYRSWAALLDAVLTEESRVLGPPAELPAHLRRAPTLLDPRVDGGKDFLASLLSPVAAGAILTRSDLFEWAAVSGAAARLGERRFVLETLWSQEPLRVVSLLGDFFAAAADRHRSRTAALGPVAVFWSARAAASASLLAELAQEIAADPTSRT